ncbi:MAG: arsenosugar biosynthesis radical SAM protein ArsS [Thermodesulfovibrionales bacterium]|nr:arsenosugar biosynthesis radical SAM protein ArsS [Thermodesulfovibrionales bacterium]
MQKNFWQTNPIRKNTIKTIQVNLGNRCNLSCSHCHIEASPKGKKMMDRHTAELVLKKILTMPNVTVEFTGGAPEMNENLQMFIEKLSHHGFKPFIRTNLVILSDKRYIGFIDLYQRCKAKLIASLPSPIKTITDAQRGDGVFDRFINVLRRLNEKGYGYDNELEIDLVSNPAADYLPSNQSDTESQFKEILKTKHNVVFNNLISITNSPIGRFKDKLNNNKSFENYMKMLINNFNYETVNNLMCRSLISVDYAGCVYDCDFNLALGIKITGYEEKRFWDIDFGHFQVPVTCDTHCYACVASCGSSCHGVIVKGVKDTVKDYYGNVLTGTKDLKTNACCSPDNYPAHIKDALKLIADEVMQKYYGCGSPIPLVLKGLQVLDIGSGTGRDCFVLSKLVGQEGFVWGIDMTEAQIDVAKRYVQYHTDVFGFSKPNISFIHDYIENIHKYFESNSLDIVVSNCVVNLVKDKEALLRQVYEILKEGGEIYFSDIYADRRLLDEIKNDPVLYGECLGGALYYKDFERIARHVGFIDCRVMSKRVVSINNTEIEQKVGNAKFYSITYRLFKLQGLEDSCEDYGHIAIYRGGIEGAEHRFILDEGHVFEKHKPQRVCGNTALILSRTRFKDYFEVIGDFNRHFGTFKDCGRISNCEGKDEKDVCC